MKPLSILKRLFLAITKNDEYSRYLLAEKATSLIYPSYKFSDYGRTFLLDREFKKMYEQLVSKDNYRSFDRKYTLNQLMRLVTNIPGDTVECGAYEGASSYFICQQITESNKSHHIFDSFQGLSEPSRSDGIYWKKGDLTSPEDKIKRNLSEFDFITYHTGWIPDTFHNKDLERKLFSFVHIDVDLYQPTHDSLQFFYDKLTVGGIILCDDYGSILCPGAKDAMDIFFKDKPEEIIELTTCQAFIIKL